MHDTTTDRPPVRLLDSDSSVAPVSAPPVSRFLSAAASGELLRKLVGFATDGGETGLSLDSSWTGNHRWARNRITTSGDVRTNDLEVLRNIRGATAAVLINTIEDAALYSAVRRAERFVGRAKERLQSDLVDRSVEPHARPAIWFDSTYNLDASHRAAIMRDLVRPAVAAGMQAAGYIEVGATGRAVMQSRGVALYYPYTTAQYSVTVRDPSGTGSGWAGVDWSDWSRVDAAHLSAIALDKCIRSRNPVAVEPGRYTAILEPQALCDLFSVVMEFLDRQFAEIGGGPFAGSTTGSTKIGLKVLDERLTVSADPMDPDLGFPPFNRGGDVYHPAVWIENGLLKNLSYDRRYAVEKLRLPSGLANSGAFRMSGGTTSIEEMIDTTKRGFLVTRFSNVRRLDTRSLVCAGNTRDGLWLIENGKVSKPVKNFRFTESPLFCLNRLEQVGVPMRVFHPGAPAIVPPVKVRDFGFSALVDAV